MANGYHYDSKGFVRNGKGEVVRDPPSKKRAKTMKVNPKYTRDFVVGRDGPF